MCNGVAALSSRRTVNSLDNGTRYALTNAVAAPDIEIESSFVVFSGRVLDWLGNFESIAGYACAEARQLSIRDVYFDTAGADLEKQRIAFRLRRKDGNVLLTLKGPGRHGAAGTTREEIERPWSAEALQEVAAYLAKRGVELQWPEPLAGFPEDILQHAGLVIVQDRTCDRLVRDLLDAGGTAVVELAVDRVHYRFGERVIEHTEVELESHGDHANDLQRVVAGLREHFGSTLKSWEYGKIATGKAIERLLRSGDLDRHRWLDDHDRLKAPAYERVQSLLHA